MNSKRTSDYNKLKRDNIIDSACLQAHLSKTLSLGNNLSLRLKSKNAVSQPRNKPNQSKPTTLTSTSVPRYSNSRAIEHYDIDNYRLCPSCDEETSKSLKSCEHCGYFFIVYNIPELSLAQKRGLVPIVEHKITVIQKDEWESIENSMNFREDAHCPICMNGFSHGHEILLSCSHIFHHHCLTAFENFMKINERSCPICRAPDYQKRKTQLGSKAYKVVCIKKIQSLWRGYCARKQFYQLRKQFYRKGEGNTRLRQQFYQKEFTSYTNSMIHEIDHRDSKIDQMFRSTDVLIQQNRQLDKLFDSILEQRQLLSMHSNHFINGISSDDTIDKTDSDEVKLKQVDWSKVIDQVVHRGFGDCPICMCGNHINVKSSLALLDCTHCFHQKCIQNLEVFYHQKMNRSGSHTLMCPVCRYVGYEKMILDHKWWLLRLADVNIIK